MKRVIVACIVILMLPAISPAQLGGLINKVKVKTKQRADQKVDQQIDKTLDELEGKKTTTPAPNDQPAAAKTSTEPESAIGLKSFSRYDFIPGDQVLYYDNFEGSVWLRC